MTAIGTVVGVAIVAVLFLLGSRPAPVSAAIVPASAPAGIGTDGFVLGQADALVTLDVYEDFQCPVCETWSQTVFPSLAAHELADGRAKLVFHDFPFIGQESSDAGRAAWAAAQQGRFWDMWATLYRNQGAGENGGAFSRDRLLAMAGAIGLDMTRFTADFDSSAAGQAVASGVTAAENAGIQGTPSLFVNGRPVTAMSYADVAAAIAAVPGS